MQQNMDGNSNILIKEHRTQNYKTIFNQKTGFFIRIEEKGCDEPFWSEHGPELLDISITNYCERGCEFCYRNSSITGKHISMHDLEKLVIEAEKIGVLQIALGGGNPNQHPQFTEILKLIRKHNIIPSYTTNGDFLTVPILEATAKYCGAIAVSAYPPYDYSFEEKLKYISEYKIKTNLHFIIKEDTIDVANEWLRNPPSFLKYINAIIFLNYKPINSTLNLHITDMNKISQFFQNVQNCRTLKIGFDSCSISGIVEYMNVNKIFMESCEAARFSAFISEDMRMYPCSFMINTDQYGDLKKETIEHIWKNNHNFTNHRMKIKNHTCSFCQHSELCNGGCVFLPEINLCSECVGLK